MVMSLKKYNLRKLKYRISSSDHHRIINLVAEGSFNIKELGYKESLLGELL